MNADLTPEQLRTAVAGAKNQDGGYILGDAVRIPCRQIHTKVAGQPPFGTHLKEVWGVITGSTSVSGVSCAEAGCCGWNASKDLAAWEEAIFQLWPDALIEKQRNKTWFTPYYEKTNKRFGPGGFSGLGVGLDALALAIAGALCCGK